MTKKEFDSKSTKEKRELAGKALACFCAIEIATPLSAFAQDGENDIIKIIVGKYMNGKLVEKEKGEKKMEPKKKTLEEIQSEMRTGDVFTMREFVETLLSGCIIPDDGIGRLHNGYEETNISPFSSALPFYRTLLGEEYPYVCWYNK